MNERRRCRPGWNDSPGRAVLVAALLAVSAMGMGPMRASAQGVGPSVAGAAAGLGVGVYTSMAVHVVRARMGSYLFAADEFFALRFESLPMLAGPVAGAVLGAEDSTALWRAMGWGGVGGLVGAGAGYGLGALLSDESESRWAGLVIGSATGLVVGSILGATRGDGDSAPIEVFSLRIPIG